MERKRKKDEKDICKTCLKADYDDEGKLVCLAKKCVYGKSGRRKE